MKAKKENREEGSILILTLLALVGALSIAVAMTSISILERKMTTKSRKSVTAFQAANSGIEWAMKKINEAEPDDKISDVFGSGEMDSGSGKINCDSGTLFEASSDIDCSVYLLSGTNQTRTEITDENTLVSDIVAIRSAGSYGDGAEETGRVLEAYAMPNCRDGEDRVADFCIEEDAGDANDYERSVNNCKDIGKRLCSASELLAYLDETPSSFSSDEEWAADITGEDKAALINEDGDIKEGDTGDNYLYRCCRNR